MRPDFDFHLSCPWNILTVLLPKTDHFVNKNFGRNCRKVKIIEQFFSVATGGLQYSYRHSIRNNSEKLPKLDHFYSRRKTESDKTRSRLRDPEEKNKTWYVRSNAFGLFGYCFSEDC